MVHADYIVIFFIENMVEFLVNVKCRCLVSAREEALSMVGLDC